MRATFTRGVIAVTLVPLLMAEFIPLLRLVFAKLRAVAIHLEFFLMMVAQAVPFGTLVLSLRIFTPISGASPAGSIAIAVIRLSGRVIGRGRRIVARAVAAADSDGKTCLRERRAAREKYRGNQEF